MSKNKFTNAFASALAKPIISENLELPTPEFQTSELADVRQLENLKVQKASLINKVSPVPSIATTTVTEDSINLDRPTLPSKTSNRKLSLKDQGWIPTTIYLPPKIKQNLQIQSINQGRDMSEIVAEVLGL